jgi:hypothetical protein
MLWRTQEGTKSPPSLTYATCRVSWSLLRSRLTRLDQRGRYHASLGEGPSGVHKRDDQLAHRNQRFHGQLGAVECPVNTAGRGSQAASGAPEVTHSCNRARFEPSNILAGSPMDGLGVSRTGARPDGDGNPRNLRIGPEIYDTSSATGTNKESDLASVDLHGRRACDLSASACTVLLGLGERLGDLDGLHRGHDRAGLGTGVEQQLAMSCRKIRYNSSTATADDHASRPPSRDAAGHHRGWPVRHPQAPTNPCSATMSRGDRAPQRST